MRGDSYATWIFGGLFALIILSGGVLVWLSPVAAGSLTPAQDTLIETADWMIKSCAGVIVGFAGGMRIVNGRRTDSAEA